ncbi:FAD-binding oxidoreductase [Hyphomicrobium sp.]|uniref:NAD(P)/FAD-dependent oxidoreductase n=1 Tax=Hyphomicrobium sp. TaxID=82 RepID=UPI002D77CDD3|nr:FAD-binding oxidoreductase [Hyphomicrobium sp.]HET6387850.1 FAD-binding oxidoreductase [Hyphomicrobium sp.]
MTAQDYIRSYYAATANDQTRYPALEGTVKADVCVIGGGFSGVATALTMAERGRSVVLLEAKRIGWGASGRNGGQMIGGISGEATIKKQLGAAGAKLVRDIRYRGHEIIESRIAKYGIACDLQYGWMEVAARPRHMNHMRAYVEDRIKDGDGGGLEIVEADQMPRVLGTSSYYGGYIDRRSGHLHPLNLVRGEANAAAQLGVQIFENSPAIKVHGGAKPWVETERGRVEAGSIVIGGEIFNRFGQPALKGLMLPAGSYIIATEPLTGSDTASVDPQNFAVADSNVVLDYYRMTPDRRMLFGGRCNYTNRDPADIAGTMRPRMIEVFPQLKDARVEFSWGGTIAIVVNRVPAIGRLEPNLYYLQGYSGHGVNATHIAAEIVSDAICGTTEQFDLFDRIKHTRLPLSDIAGNYMLALGMLYYRIRDLL